MSKIAARIVIPADVQFAGLKLLRAPKTGDIELDWAPIERICAASGLNISLCREQSEDNFGALPDLVMDALIAEADIEDTHGHGFSHQPGQA